MIRQTVRGTIVLFYGAKMHLNLDPQLQNLIETAVRSGRFSNAEELITAGVTRVIADDIGPVEVDDDLRAEIEIGLRDAEAGNFVEFTAAEIIAEGREELRRRQRGGSA
jgi:Arc/MetJ-type ribon-helix-helix transcriptional regulator